MVPYKARFHSLSRYALPLLPTEEERIRRFVKGLNVGLQVSALQMVSSGKTFQEVVEYVKSVKGLKQEGYTRNAKKKARRVGFYSGSFARAPAPQGLSGRLIQ